MYKKWQNSLLWSLSFIIQRRQPRGGEGSWDHIRVAREKRRECKVRFARHIKWRGCSDGFVQLRQVAICILLVRWPILARSYILRTRWRHQRGICTTRENRAHFHSWAFLCVLESPSKTIWGQFVVWWICLVIIFISFLDNSYNCQTCIKRSVGLPQERLLNTGWTVLSNGCIWISVISARKCNSRHHVLQRVLAGRPRPQFQRPPFKCLHTSSLFTALYFLSDYRKEK